ncbi:DUF4261 domain-containing protein [Fusobacterium massiliense]|uniref:DUF4261 domain-containing protein n=1 Tax=Fusobacterium massiliense TaxID=1852365 RepID=UPI000940329E|nr:DUF4261 domain-containing protein [Fusobacterium massiliense]
MNSVFISSILLNEAKFNKKIFKAKFEKDWRIKLKEEGENTEDDANCVFDIDGMIAGIVLMPTKIPNDEAIYDAKTNFKWKEAVKVAEEHIAHILVTLTIFETTDLVEASKIYTKIVSTLASEPECIGIDTLGTVLNPAMYIDFTKYYDDREMFPVENMIFIGMYSNKPGTVSAYTYGMNEFLKKDMEIIDSMQKPEDVYYLLQGIIDYIITSNVILQDGETIGFSEEQKISITESDGVAIEGKSLKLGF